MAPERSDDLMIVTEGLEKSLEGYRVLRGVDLEVVRGETLVILGRSGSGKTVLLKHIIGLLRPDAGRLWVDGVELTRLGERELERQRLKFGMLFQDSALFDSLTVGQNVGFALNEHRDTNRTAIRERVAECLAMVGLPGIEEMSPEQLSGGMKKRVALARAIAMEPRVILYDEPTSGVDPLMAEEINRLIVALRERLAVTSIVVTHNVSDAYTVADRVALLEDGRIAACDSPGPFATLQNEAVQRFIRGER